MRSYLSLIPISAKVHRRGNRMTTLCIVIAVFLVTVMFSLADMATGLEEAHMREKHGNWHIRVSNLSEEDARQIRAREDVLAAAAYNVINDDASEAYSLDSMRAAVYGADEDYVTVMMNGLKKGDYPAGVGEIMVSTNAETMLGLEEGDMVTLQTPAGSREYIVSGIGETDSQYNQQAYLVGIFMNREAFEELCAMNGKDISPEYYIQFTSSAGVRASIAQVMEEYGLTDENVAENKGVLAMTGDSANESVNGFYLTAIVLFALILAAGVMMISGNINSNIAQRTRFFGMLRCIGMSRQQVIRFVRLEALNWCRTAIPMGVFLGVAVTWGVRAVLRTTSEFADIPVFGISVPGIVSGVLMGVVTVFISAQSPAKRASKVSPMAAVSGNTGNAGNIRRAANIRLGGVETALGVHHAVSEKKNLALMTGSFVLSVIVILGFFVILDFARCLLPAMYPWQPDLSIGGYVNACTIDRKIADEIGALPGVERVFGNIFISGVPAETDTEAGIDTIDVVSYDEYMLDCAAGSVMEGDLSKIYMDSGFVATIHRPENPLKAGDKIWLGEEEFEIGCTLSDGLFMDRNIIICSEETFIRLFGESDYTMLNVQLESDAPDTTVSAVRNLSGSENIFTDLRESNKETRSMYWLTRIFAYGFLVIIGLIAVFHIMNSISMSVSARIGQYGAMRAVGMDGRQVTKMIAAEAFTYILSGYVLGCALGLILSQTMYVILITEHFGIAWSVPFAQLLMIFALLVCTGAAAVYGPAKRIRNMAVTETIGEL